MEDLTLMAIDDLITELKNYCAAYVISYQHYDEDAGLMLKHSTYESYKAQALGLAYRLYWWLIRRSSFNATRTDHINNNSSDDVVNEISTIIKELSNRCPAVLFSCVRREDDIIFLYQKVKEHGQALGVAYELNEWINSLNH